MLSSDAAVTHIENGGTDHYTVEIMSLDGAKAHAYHQDGYKDPGSPRRKGGQKVEEESTSTEVTENGEAL